MFAHPQLTLRPVPYLTFPFANRRGTTIVDRSTAYPVFGWRAGRIAASLVREGAIDIVHGLGASVLGYATTAPQGRRAPLVMNPQGLEEFGATDPSRAPLKRLAYAPLRVAVRKCAAVADRVIATDRSLVASVVTHLRVDRSVVCVIPNAIELSDTDRIDSAARAQDLRGDLGLESGDPLLVSVSRLEANKGYEILVRALARLTSNRQMPPKWRWVLVGEGPRRTAIAREIRAAGLQAHVVMWGRAQLEDLHGWYEAATVFVHPTLYEGSSLVTLEAMAHRKAIIASKAGGLPDKVIPGGNGWLVPPGDVEALSDAIRSALADKHRLYVMGDASRALVEREFAWSAVADRLMDVYRELLGARGSL
jgi:glycosyltransferase involved in cell wall biosynthesis